MVVLSAAIVTKGGKPLLARQYVEMKRNRIEGLLSAFPKLVGSDGRQHTYVETDNVRYVYHPLEEAMYLVLVTNKSSNILEDLEVLQMLSKIVPESCPQLDEEGISSRAFDLLFAFDEAISQGHKENVTMSQIRQYIEMESHEEKLHKIILQSKINETRDVMKKKAQEIEKQKIENREKGMGGMGGSGGSMPGMGGGGFGSGGSGGFGGGGFSASGMDGSYDDMGGSSSYASSSAGTSSSSSRARQPPVSKGPSRGMVLGKAKAKESSFLDAMRAEGEIVDDVRGAAAAAGAGSAMAPAMAQEPIEILVEEKIKALLAQDGGVESLEVQGTMSLQIQEQDNAFIRVHIETGDNRDFQFKTHPNIDKALHSRENVLGIKDPNRPFPTGSPLGILKWRHQSGRGAASNGVPVPLTINCWPSVSGGESYVNIEYECEAKFDLHNVTIVIPLPASRDAPRVNSIESGDTAFDSRNSCLVWNIDMIDGSNSTGSMEFVLPATDSSSFFPIDVNFEASSTFCDIRIREIENLQGGAFDRFKYDTVLACDSYQIA